jgi:unsaturated rhamnogalacturonyl hydrolase
LTLGTLSVTIVFPQAPPRSARAWGERLADSEIQRQGDSLFLDRNPKAKWAYETGVFLKGLEAISERTRNPKYREYAKRVTDSYLETDGAIKTYKMEDFNLDNINCGKMLLVLYRQTREEKYRAAASRLMTQLESQPRTKEGGFWHKKIYPYQMWLDGIYMASVFHYVQATGRLG